MLLKNRFDQVARSIQIGAKADWVFAISFRRNVRPNSLLSDKLPDPICVAGLKFAECGSHAFVARAVASIARRVETKHYGLVLN
jgi:hypothetical protein